MAIYVKRGIILPTAKRREMGPPSMIVLETALTKINTSLCQVAEYGDEGEEGPRNRR